MVNPIEDKLDQIPLLAGKIEKASTLEDTSEVAIELYRTLGFCHGFLNKEVMDFPEEQSEEFPWNLEILEACKGQYAQEYIQGIDFRKDME